MAKRGKTYVGRTWRLFLGICHSWRDNFSGCGSFIILNSTILVVSFFAYLVNQFVLKRISGNFLIHGYVNDFLAIPLLLAYSNILILLGARHYMLFVTLRKIIPFTILVGFFWEYVTPLYRSSKVCDPYDLIAYLLGSVTYYLIINNFNQSGEKPCHTG